MISQKAIYITAQLLITQHGDDAEDIVAQKMQGMLKKDDMPGAGVWLAVGQAIENLKACTHQGKLH